jgi:DNA polymerase-3 subunit alpha
MTNLPHQRAMGAAPSDPAPGSLQQAKQQAMELIGAERYGEAAEFRKLVAEDKEAARAYEVAKGLEGLKRSTGVHAAGVIISAEPLFDVIPVMTREGEDGIVTQFDQPPLEKLGLLKMDFLGLRNLTVIDDALENIRNNGKTPPVLEELDLDADEKAYQLLSAGDTLGVFQLDGDNTATTSQFAQFSAVVSWLTTSPTTASLMRPGHVGSNPKCANVHMEGWQWGNLQWRHRIPLAG